ncbi:MAG: 23S rRNA (uracil(1939)-C(5))-methyltransferase RlmD [Clostridia bacterium]|nr:23S rRNA (uracil(1939)-C(5))-methyltransferase RlmD [Clostridia bacterium]
MIMHGDVLTLEITETNMLGNGVAKVDGAVVFCRGAIEGDVVTALVTDVKKNFAEARRLEVIVPSPYRREARCPYAAVCGGCEFDGVDPEYEKSVKAKGISASFRREGIRIDPPEVVSCGTEGYRNKAVFHFDETGKCGFFAAETHEFVKIEKCFLCDDKINEIKNTVEEILSGEKELSPSDLTYLYIRYMKETDEASVAIGYTGDANLADFAKKLARKLPYVKCVVRGEKSSPEAKDERFELLFGKEEISARAASLDFSVSPASFFQVNVDGACEIAKAVVRFAGLMDGERAADIYCGAGLFGLTLAKNAPGAEVYGIELNADAVRHANENAKRNGIKNAFFMQGDSSELASKAGIDSLDAAVVDPPRTGLSKKTVCELLELSPKRIVYVSCNPSTLARDVKLLSEKYALCDAVGIDLFGRTKHCEVVAMLSRHFASR